MSLPRPAQFEDMAANTAEVVIPRLIEGYRWAYPLGYDRKIGEHVRTGGVVNPTLTTVETFQRFRDEVRLMAKLATEGAASLRGADAALARAFAFLDQDADHTPAAYHDPRLRFIDTGELSRAQKAQKRRMERGEGWGHG